MKVQDILQCMSQAELEEVRTLVTKPDRLLFAGMASGDYVENKVYPHLGHIAKSRLMRLLSEDNYIPTPNVNLWFHNASEGERAHMANKLAKHGYPLEGKHAHHEIYNRAYEDGRASLCD